MCVSCAIKSAEIAMQRAVIFNQRQKIRQLTARINTMKAIAGEIYRHIKQQRQKDYEVLSQDSGIQRGKWIYHKGSFERLEPCQNYLEQILRT